MVKWVGLRYKKGDSKVLSCQAFLDAVARVSGVEDTPELARSCLIKVSPKVQ